MLLSIPFKILSYCLSPSFRSVVLQISPERLPTHAFNELIDPNRKVAPMEEMHDLNKNETWDIVDLPKGKEIVGCKQVYGRKYNSDGIVQ